MQSRVRCKNCGSGFWAKSSDELFCERCDNIFEEKYDEIKGYIETHPKVFIVQVAMDFGIPVIYIKGWLQEERFHLPEGSIDHLFCERCGAELLAGRFCDRCKELLKDPSVYEKFEKELKRREYRHRLLQLNMWAKPDRQW